MGPMIEIKSLEYTKFYIEIVGVNVLFGQRLFGVANWFSYTRVESWATQCAQDIVAQEGFTGPANIRMVVEPNLWVQLAS